MSDETWRAERAVVAERVGAAHARGLCATCHDLATGEVYGDDDRLIYEDDLFKVLLERFPRVRGHTIVIYKPHREDISELTDDEAEALAVACLRTIRALKSGLGAEKVYLNTMCDGPRNHLHLQLFPRYAGEDIGSRRFVLPRSGLEDATAMVDLLRSELSPPDTPS